MCCPHKHWIDGLCRLFPQSTIIQQNPTLSPILHLCKQPTAVEGKSYLPLYFKINPNQKMIWKVICAFSLRVWYFCCFQSTIFNFSFFGHFLFVYYIFFGAKKENIWYNKFHSPDCVCWHGWSTWPMDYINFKVIHQKAKLRILLNKMIYFINIRVKY